MIELERDPFGQPVPGRTLAKLWAALGAVLTGQLTKYPPWVRRFEHDFAAHVWVAGYGLAFCNGTSSLEAALFALGVVPGDRVLVPALTFHAAITPVLNAGAEPVFVDVDAVTANLCLDDFKSKAPGAKAAVITHMWGNPTPMTELEPYCREHELALVEDCSLAVGAEWRERKVGSFGRIGFFSLQQEKAVSAGEGGICITDEKDLWRRMALFGHFNRAHKEADHPALEGWPVCGVGHKLRAHPLGIALAAVELTRLESDNSKRREVAEELAGWLSETGHRLLFVPTGWGGTRKLALLLKNPTAAQAAGRLRQAGLKAEACNYRRWHLNPYFRQPEFRREILGSNPANPESVEDNCPNMQGYLERLLLLDLDRRLLRRYRGPLLKVLAEC